MRATWLSAAALVATALSTVGFCSASWADEPAAGAAAAKPDLAHAQQIVSQTCGACHGADGNSAIPANPSLAGQHAEYITLQLQHFKAGIRNNPIMMAMVGTLTPDDMRALGIYFSQQKPKGGAAKDAELLASGQTVFRAGNAASRLPACAACHAPNGGGIPVRYPRVGGQSADYIVAQLKAFKAGERGMDKAGKDVNGKVMAQVAARMTDAEMQAVAQYVAGLH